MFRSLLLLLAFWSLPSCVDDALLPPCPAPPPLLPPVSFVQRDGAALTLAGAPFRFIGANAYDLLPALQRGRRASVEARLDLASSLGLTVLRVWAFNTDRASRHRLHAGPGAFNEAGLQALDELVALASARGLRLILVLQNNWPDYGGIDAYGAQVGVDGRPDLWGSERVRGLLIEYATTLAGRRSTVTGRRYGEEPAILGWDLLNEPRCEAPGCAPDVLITFLVPVAAALRAAAPRQLIGVGDEGFARERGVDRAALAATGAFDWVSVHLWPQHWREAPPGADRTLWMTAEGEAHLAGAADTARAAGLPLLVGELGWASPDPLERAEVFAAWLDAADRQGASGALVWRLAGERDPNIDGYALHPTTDPQASRALCHAAHALEPAP